MDKLIKMSYGKSFSDSDISRLCEGKVNIYEYKDLRNFDTIEQMLAPYNCAIILYTTKANYGHWVAIILHNNGVLEHFDSYALAPDQELNFTPKDKRKELGEEYPYLTKLMYDSPYDVIYNKVKLQKFKQDYNQCGRWCGLRVVFRELPLRKFCSLFMKQKFEPDYYVTALTMFV